MARARGPYDPLTRRRPAAESERLLRRYFGGKRCVVRGSTESVHWHHIDDRSDTDAFENFLPLGSDLNLKLRDIRSRVGPSRLQCRLDADPSQASFHIPNILWPDSLLAEAQRSQASWDVARAFGQSRLAYYIARLYVRASPDEVLKYATDTLRYLRHRPDYRLLRDVLARDIAPLAAKAQLIGENAAARMLVEIAYVYSEHREIARSIHIHEAIAPKLRRRCNGDGWYANARRRYENVAALTETGSRLAVARIKNAARLAPDSLGIQVASSTYIAYHHFGGGEPARARDVLEPFTEVLLPAMTSYANPLEAADRLLIPHLNVAIGAQFLQAYAMVRDAETGWPKRDRSTLHRVVGEAFRRGGMLLDHEVPFAWHEVLPEYQKVVCQTLDRRTRLLLDGITSRLLPIVTG